MIHGGAHGAYGTAEGAGGPRVVKPFALRGRRRMNIVGMSLSLYVPWVVYCLAFGMLSFFAHYEQPRLCDWVVRCGGILTCLVLVGSIMLRPGSKSEEGVQAGASWWPFLSATTLLALVVAVVMGARNFPNTQIYYDLDNLNTYADVDPSRMRGQELMDAGRMDFVNGTHLDLKRSIGFKNVDVYCVAPITGGLVAGEATLASYDFWAVGKNCCSPDAGVADFTCGQAKSLAARSGLRMVRDDDRSFYRLAVQQAQSAYQIKANHPLFFTWVENANTEMESYKHAAFQYYLAGMYGYFFFQLLLVAAATSML